MATLPVEGSPSLDGVKINPETFMIEPKSFKKFIDENIRSSKNNGEQDLEALRQSIVLENRPKITFDQIGGQKEAVEQAQALAKQIAHPEVFEQWGVDVPRGILFYGEPGNGKTLIAKALAHETNAAFLSVNASDVAAKWYGDPEKLAKGVFLIAQEEAKNNNGHCIIFLDEVDAIMPTRTGNIHEASRKVMAEILTQIDGIKGNKGITIVASTNTRDMVDKAFLSRMNQWINVKNPDAVGLAQIMKIHFDQASKLVKRELIADNIDFLQFTKNMKDVSGRDVGDIVNAVLRTKAMAQLETSEITEITKVDIEKAINDSAKVMTTEKKKVKATMGFPIPNVKNATPLNFSIDFNARSK